MDKVEQTFSRFLNDKEELAYPDFEVMWVKIEQELPSSDTKLQAVEMILPKRKRYRKVAILAALAAILVATPVVAAISTNWERLFPHRSGIQSALQMGLGQLIGQSVTNDGITLTIDKAIVDDNRTVILYTLSAQESSVKDLYFSQVSLKDSQGKVIEGDKFQLWNEANKTMNGYFETEWTPEQVEADIEFIAQKLQAFTPVEREIAFKPLDGQKGTYAINQDGIEHLTIQPFEQGENMLLKSAITFNQSDSKAWAFPNIAVYKGGTLLKSTGPDVYGTPGEQGEYTGQQSFKVDDLKSADIVYKLKYTKESRRIDKTWSYQLHLDKKQMLSGTVKRTLNIPIEDSGVSMVLKEMVVTPTQIRIKVAKEKYSRVPYMNYELEVGDTLLKGGYTYNHDDPTETTYRFERPPGTQITEGMPMSFVASYQVVEHKDAKDPIRLTNISEEKKTMTTQVGGYPVLWTYYKQDGNLYIQSECADPSFGGVNQTYMYEGAQSVPGQQVTANFSGDGNNKVIDMYPNYKGTEAELRIYWYYTDNPEKTLKVNLLPAN